MKIAVCSDLHLEFGDLDLQNEENADVLILGGDIFVAADLKDWSYDSAGVLKSRDFSTAARGERYNDFIVRCCQNFPKVIMVSGNHEHYHGDFAESIKIIKAAFKDLTNFHFLDKESIIIDDVLFYGGTLWTDFNGEDPETIEDIRHMMNDFRIIGNSNKTIRFTAHMPDPNNPGKTIKVPKERTGAFLPEDALEDHKAFLQGLNEVLNLHADKKTVVVGHHAPSRNSTHPRYRNERVMNGAYSSYLDYIMMNNRQIKLWTHGHTHDDYDYMIQTCRVVCNPRGYINYEERADDFKLKYVEI